MNIIELLLNGTFSQYLLKNQIIKSIVFLSDIFNIQQFEWMLELFHKLYEGDQIIDDFLTKRYLIIGICKVKKF